MESSMQSKRKHISDMVKEIAEDFAEKLSEKLLFIEQKEMEIET